MPLEIQISKFEKIKLLRKKLYLKAKPINLKMANKHKDIKIKINLIKYLKFS